MADIIVDRTDGSGFSLPEGWAIDADATEAANSMTDDALRAEGPKLLADALNLEEFDRAATWAWAMKRRGCLPAGKFNSKS
ncbi:hypothetical protein [Azospirillum sp.]|uniref:hypothetical protein n=1 Tax=Azospirillum sp. TaxID=34012 RepID=UPI002D4BAF5E|nr:hypothetical protein [Azospirillum sp.]HYF86192.1 hypothetical protein [Azospirillum sp.]